MARREQPSVSEGGRTNVKRRPVLTEQVMVRFSKAELMELEQEAAEREWSLAQTIRARCRRGADPIPPAREVREPFEEAP
jgi:hypothetical protein